MGRLLKNFLRFFWVFATSAIFFACTPQAYKRVKPIQVVTVSASGDTITEGSSGTVAVTLSKAADVDFSISYETATGTAGSNDFTAESGTLTIAAGETSKTLTVATNDDAIYEGDEKFSVSFSTSDSDLSIPETAKSVDVTITDNDSAPEIQFDVSDSSAAENVGTKTISISLSAASEVAASVSYQIVNASSSGAATGGGADYTLGSTGVVSFAPGETTKTISVAIVNDHVLEIDEVVQLSLVSANEATVGGVSTHTLTIVDNDTPDATQSTLVATKPVVANGTSTSLVTITLKNADGDPIFGTATAFSSSGSANTIGSCGSTNSSGVATCTLSSTKAETKTLSVSTPIDLTAVTDTVTFTQAVSVANSSITATDPVVADGVATSTITITLKDYMDEPVVGQSVDFSVTGTLNTKGACSVTNSSGVATCTLASTKAETKTLAISSPAGLTAVTTTVTFSQVASLANSSISASGPVTANGVATSTVSITVKDYSNSAIVGATVGFDASGSDNTLGSCSVTNSSGVATCTLSSTHAETKTLTVTNPSSASALSAIIDLSTTVSFVAGAPSVADSSISGDTNVVADGIAESVITFTVKDANANPIAGQSVNLSVSGSNNTVTGCPAVTNSSGVATCSLKSTTAEWKTIAFSQPSELSTVSNTVRFVSATTSADPAHSTISGTEPVNADGVSFSTVTITLRDASNNPVANQSVNFSVDGSGNTKDACSDTDATGVSTCKLYSTVAETKTISISTPTGFTSVQNTVQFVAVVKAEYSSMDCSPLSVAADNSSTSSCTVTVKDYANAAMAGVSVVITATGTGNTLSGCSGTTNGSGQLTGCTIRSSVAESKTMSVSSPAALSSLSKNINFTQTVDPSKTTIACSPSSVAANNSDTSSCTVTVKDFAGVVMSGVSVNISATGTGNTISGCPALSDNAGQAVCTIRSTGAEVKTVSVTSPAASTATDSVTFTAQPSTTYSKIDCDKTSVIANNQSIATCSATVKDFSNAAISGTSVTIVATGTGNTLSGCSGTTNASGVLSGCTIRSSAAGTKTLSMSVPAALSTITKDVTFTTPAADLTLSQFVCTGTPVANNVQYGTCTITVRDADNVAMSGVAASFTVTSGSVSGAGASSNTTISGCSTAANTDSNGQRSCKVYSTVAETKTFTVAAPSALVTKTTTLVFSAQTPFAANSSFDCTPKLNINANGTTNSTCTFTVRDSDNVVISGIATTASVTNSSGSSTTCGNSSTTNASGQRTCTISATTAGTRALSVTAPSQLTSLASVSVQFVAQVPSSTYSSFVCGDGTGVTSVTCTITVKDTDNAVIANTATTATITSGTSATTTCSNSVNTNSSGVRTCTLSSTVGGVKTLTMATPSQLTSLTASATFQDPAVLLVRADTTSYDYDGNFFFSTRVASGSTATKTFNVKNIAGTYGATATSVSVDTSSFAAPFTLTSNSCGTSGSPISLAKDATCSFTLTFSPTAPGGYSDDIKFNYVNGFGSSTSVTSNTYYATATGEKKVLPTDRATGDYFGKSVAMSGQLAIVGATQENTIGIGKAYLYRYNGSNWTQEQTLTDSAGSLADAFGSSVDISGNYAVVGSPLAKAGGTDRGKAQIWNYNGSAWVMQQELTRTSAACGAGVNGDKFGTSVAIHGTKVIVGNPFDDWSKQNRGSASIYSFDGSAWIVSCLKESATNAEDNFGTAVDISGDVVVVGAHKANTVYVYRLVGTTWTKEATLTGSAGDGFGKAVSIDGSLIAVGAPDAGSGKGKVYFYFYDVTNKTWAASSFTTVLGGNSIGRSVSVSGDIVLVGADVDATYTSGIVHQIRQYATSESSRFMLFDKSFTPSDAGGDEDFGRVVAASGGNVLIGAYLDNGSPSITTAGSVYFFNDSTTPLSQALLPYSGSGSASTSLSGSVSTSNGVVAIGTLSSSVLINRYVGEKGGMYGTGFNYEAEITDSTVTGFGLGAISLWRDLLLVGSPDSSTFSIYRRSNVWNDGGTEPSMGYWTKEFSGVPTGDNNFSYGSYAAIFGNFAVVTGSVWSAAAIYRRDGTGAWAQTQTISTTKFYPVGVAMWGNYMAIASNDWTNYYVEIWRLDPATGNFSKVQTLDGASASLVGTTGSGFGLSIDMHDGLLIVGSPYVNKAFVFRNTGTSFVLESTLTPPANEAGIFGQSVAINQNQALVGIPRGTVTNAANNKGHAILYQYVKGSGWVQKQALNPTYTNKDYFGSVVDLDENTAVVAPGINGTSETNNVYVYPIGP